MNIVPHHHHSCEATSSKIQQFFTEFHVSQILRSCNAYKLRGFAVMAIFLVAFEAVFQRRSFYQWKKDAPESIPFERDTFYRFLNSCAIHWRKFTLLLDTAIIQKAIAPEKMHFCFQGRMQDVMALYRSQKKRRGRSAYLLSVEAEASRMASAFPYGWSMSATRTSAATTSSWSRRT